MDVVLEVLDTYLFDRLYANVLPISSSVPLDPISTIAASFRGYNDSLSIGGGFGGDSSFAKSSWQYVPASHSFGCQPSEYAYMSRWDRDNAWRQLFSLYIITW